MKYKEEFTGLIATEEEWYMWSFYWKMQMVNYLSTMC